MVCILKAAQKISSEPRNPRTVWSSNSKFFYIYRLELLLKLYLSMVVDFIPLFAKEKMVAFVVGILFRFLLLQNSGNFP